MWRSEDNLLESVLSSHLVGPEDPTQGARLSENAFYLLGHLASSALMTLFNFNDF